MQEKRNTKKKIVLAICLVTIVFVGVLASFAYIAGLGNNVEDPFESNLSMGNMALTFSDGDNGINAKLGFGETVTKRFVIENTGSLETSLSLDWDNFVNTYLDRSLSYSLSYSETEDGAYTKIVEETNMPTSATPVSRPLASELSVPAGKTYYYNLDITLNNLEDVDQTSDLSAQFTTEFDVGQPKKYRYYTLKVDMNGGVWQEFTSPQEYQLKNDETLEIPDPTREGYTFTGWSIDGVSSELNGNTFSMGISNSTLTANWSVNKYNVSIDGSVEEVEYNSSIELTTPTKEGYTFTGWNTSGGQLNGNTFTLTEAKDITITSTFVVNNYKYIVYHNQMNTSGNGYTLVSADTDEGEAAFGSTISPNTKVYQGFTAPNKQSLTIRVDNSNPPTLNVVNYNYTRNRYTLTIDPNGGTYTGSTSLDLYYGASTTIGTPNKVGYNFTNWTNTGSGSISGTTFTMGVGNSTLRANYTPKTYSVTFNANGGVTTTESKTVTYDSTYGDLPTPTYSGYRFLGWFTAATGGTEVVSSTQVSLTSNQTLFAHWEKINTSEEVIAKLNIPKKSGSPNFANIATTDETANGLYAMEDDYGTSYYYRGAVENNYVKFGGFYWRIIRINGDGSIRMQYDGTQGYANANWTDGYGQLDRWVFSTSISFNKTTDAKHVGFMYGGSSTATSTKKNGNDSSAATYNETDSQMKTKLDEWYETNLKTNSANNNRDLTTYLSDEIFCNDRSTGSTPTEWWKEEGTAIGYGSNKTMYGSSHRLYDTDFKGKTPTPQLKCPEKNDAFTVNDTAKGNGALRNKVGLITADEVILAGGSVTKSNQAYYLYKYSEHDLDGIYFTNSWTMSPYAFSNNNSKMYVIDTIGTLTYATTQGNSLIMAVAPVINLSIEAALTLSGTGTMNDPYRIPGVE